MNTDNLTLKDITRNIRFCDGTKEEEGMLIAWDAQSRTVSLLLTADGKLAIREAKWCEFTDQDDQLE